jgi:hypothetical protein
MKGIMAKEILYNVCYRRIKSPSMSRKIALEFAAKIISEKGEDEINVLFRDGKPVGKSTRLKFIKETKEISN